jgi:hypothetical protein
MAVYLNVDEYLLGGAIQHAHEGWLKEGETSGDDTCFQFRGARRQSSILRLRLRKLLTKSDGQVAGSLRKSPVFS